MRWREGRASDCAAHLGRLGRTVGDDGIPRLVDERGVAVACAAVDGEACFVQPQRERVAIVQLCSRRGGREGRGASAWGEGKGDVEEA